MTWPVHRSVKDQQSSFGVGLKKIHISSVSWESRSHEPKTVEKSSYHDRNFPVIVRNELKNNAKICPENHLHTVQICTDYCQQQQKITTGYLEINSLGFSPSVVVVVVRGWGVEGGGRWRGGGLTVIKVGIFILCAAYTVNKVQVFVGCLLACLMNIPAKC